MARVLLLLLLAAACGRGDRPTLLAAASLQRVVPEILAGQDVRVSFAATSTLARQIEHGLAADVLLSADRPWIDYLRERGHGIEERLFARAELVAWVRAEGGAGLAGAGRIAVGAENVPVGRYARAALRALDVDESRLLPCRDARAVVAALEAGEADVAIAYGSQGAPGLRVAHRFAEPRVEYWALLCRDRPEARRLWERLRSGGPILARHGLVP